MPIYEKLSRGLRTFAAKQAQTKLELASNLDLRIAHKVWLGSMGRKRDRSEKGISANGYLHQLQHQVDAALLYAMAPKLHQVPVRAPAFVQPQLLNIAK